MGTNVEYLALYVWEKCGIAGTLCMGTSVKFLAQYAWKRMWNGWQCMHGNKCGMGGYLCI